VTLANGARPAYLPTEDAYGKGIYQESIAVLAPGSLERLVGAVGEQIQDWLSAPDAAQDGRHDSAVD